VQVVIITPLLLEFREKTNSTLQAVEKLDLVAFEAPYGLLVIASAARSGNLAPIAPHAMDAWIRDGR
jgi:hypothetical protein